MDAVVPSAGEVDTLRAIVRCGFDRDETLRLCSAAGWELLGEIPESKVLQYRAGFGAGGRSKRVVTVHREDDLMAPTASVPLGLFRLDPPPDRQRYDREFRNVEGGLVAMLGPPHRAGKYTAPHRTDRPFLYAWWRLADAAVVLVQNQFDADSDLDVSLWVFPPRDEVRLPVTEN